MTDFQWSDSPSAIVVAIGTALATVWGATFGSLHSRVRKVEEKCASCPAAMMKESQDAHNLLEDRWDKRIAALEVRIMTFLTVQNEERGRQFERLERLFARMAENKE